MDELKHLKPGETRYPQKPDSGLLDTFPNPRPSRPYTVRFSSREVTSLCPVTGQPDFYHVTVEYRPAEHCLESKSVKLYLMSFRNEGVFAEDMANRMLDDFVAACSPGWMKVHCSMKPRGGISMDISAEYAASP